MAKSEADYRASQREIMNRKRAAEREIEIPAVVNPRRRAACRLDLIKFTKSYFSQPPDADRLPGEDGLACLPLSSLHIGILKEFQSRILFGGLKSLAAPRGFGKDTMAIIAAIWAWLYGHSRFSVIACFEATAAASRMETIKRQVEINCWLKSDFPEVCEPVRALERAAQRAKGQTYQGEFTRAEWGHEIVAATIPGSAASGCIIAPASLSGSIRGMNKAGQRPSFVILTDPQTSEIARSTTQVKEVLNKIKADFGGLGSVKRSLACLALVTIIRRHDVADQLTDPARYPQWSGERHKALEAMPERMDLWDEYDNLLEAGKTTGDTTGRGAHKFYLKNRKAMDAGAVVSWRDAYIREPAPDGSKLEASALQHFMNLRWTWGEEAFKTEYQNEPPEAPGASGITWELVASRLSHLPHCVAPAGARLTRMIDVGGRELHYAVLAAGPEGGGEIIDYGIERIDAPAGNLKDPNGEVREALERAVLDKLRAIRDNSRGEASPYRDAEGKKLEVELTLVDSGWLEQVVYIFCRESGPRWRASKGHQARPGSSRYVEPGRNQKGVVVGHEFFGRIQVDARCWLWSINSDHWKMFVHERFLQSPGTTGAWSLFGSESRQHKRFGQHVCAEEWSIEANRWSQLSKFNHWLDCAAGAAAAAAMLGVRVVSGAELVTVGARTYIGREGEKKSNWNIGR